MKLIKYALFTAIFCSNLLLMVPDSNAQQQNPRNALEYFRRSLEFMMIGDYHNAIINSNHVIRLDPNSAVAYVIRARAYYELNDYENVITDCSNAIRLDRNNLSAYNLRANAYIQNGDFDRAIADWQAVLRINPEFTEASQNIETASQMRGE